ncbi:hypothetical protein CCACVL1_13833 [Corchorus capsularis]|uniref:Uncharacterized protein n=1 Tax=Corchorus capsularis TaxID=210143 RepID=A0A1R3I9H6_COCAP|nr:hypothetical protein CCACVL1_13833 [Corchorus capsularis]
MGRAGLDLNINKRHMLAQLRPGGAIRA